jgi:hypothetical protein
MPPARGFGPGGGASVLAQVAPVNPTGTITPASADALKAAWLDERRAQAFYGAVLEKHGQVRPFTNILNAEKRHEQAVATLMDRDGVSRPSNDGTDVPGVPGVPATIAECATLSAQVERDNVAMYDRLLKDVSEPDVRAVLENLRAASLNNHLPTFERVADRASAGLNQGAQFGPGRGCVNGTWAGSVHRSHEVHGGRIDRAREDHARGCRGMEGAGGSDGAPALAGPLTTVRPAESDTCLVYLGAWIVHHAMAPPGTVTGTIATPSGPSSIVVALPPASVSVALARRPV